MLTLFLFKLARLSYFSSTGWNFSKTSRWAHWWVQFQSLHWDENVSESSVAFVSSSFRKLIRRHPSNCTPPVLHAFHIENAVFPASQRDSRTGDQQRPNTSWYSLVPSSFTSAVPCHPRCRPTKTDKTTDKPRTTSLPPCPLAQNILVYFFSRALGCSA